MLVSPGTLQICALVSFILLRNGTRWQASYDPHRIDGVTLLCLATLTLALTEAFDHHLGRAFFSSTSKPNSNGNADQTHGLLRPDATNVTLRSLSRKAYRSPISILVVCCILRYYLHTYFSSSYLYGDFYLEGWSNCTQKGLWAFAPLVFLIYEATRPCRQKVKVDSDEPEDMWSSFSDELQAWMAESTYLQAVSFFLISIGTFMALNSYERSTAVCPPMAPMIRIVMAQIVCLEADAAIVVISARYLDCSKAPARAGRVNTSFALAAAEAAIFIIVQGGVRTTSFTDPFIINGVLAIFLASVAALLQLTSLSGCSAIFTSLTGAMALWDHVKSFRSFAGIPGFQLFWLAPALAAGFSLSLHRSHIESFAYLSRWLLILCSVLAMLGVSIYAMLGVPLLDGHPLDEFIYQARIKFERWQVSVSTSQSLRVAVQEYKDRHDGRLPPPNFDKWYDFAVDKSSVVIDEFPLLDQDLLPFWSLQPRQIRDSIDDIKSKTAHGSILAASIIKIVDGKVSAVKSEPYATDVVLDTIVGLIEPFAQYLPDMELLINGVRQARVMATHAAKTNGRGRDSFAHSVTRTPELARLTCPATSATRKEALDDMQTLCTSCLKPQTLSQFIVSAYDSRDICHQPDLLHMHDSFLTSGTGMGESDLVPIFSPWKTESYADIVIPMTWSSLEDEIPDDKKLPFKSDRLYWRGMHGPWSGQAARLAHITNNVSQAEMVTMILPTEGDKSKYKYVKVPTYQANAALPFDIGVTGFVGCIDEKGCKTIGQYVRTSPPDTEKYFDSRYNLLVDERHGPPPDVLKFLRSYSLPFISSIYREWYSDRLSPWLHYVPMDIRFHALHSTLAYFTGIKGNTGSTVPEMNAYQPWRFQNAVWIANQGRTWAKTAIRKEDAQVYMFRLLLEWGRIIKDDRDRLGFEMPVEQPVR